MADDSRAGLVKRRPRRSNSLKDLQRLLAPAGMTYEQSRKDRLATTASYLVRPVEGARSLDLRRRFMELELSGTGLLPPKPDVPFDEPHRFGKLLDILDGGGEIPQPRPAIKAPAQSNLPPVRDPTLEVKVRGWSGLPRAKILDKEARRLDKEYVKPRRPDEDKLLNASRGKLSTEIERQRSGDLQWLKVEADIARIESDDRALWRTLKKFDEAMSGKLVRGHRLGGFKPCADPYWHPIVVEAERRWIAALDALETSRFKPDFGVIDPFAPLPEKSAALKRVDRDRATLNSDTMQLRIEAVEALRIDLWQEWKPTRHDGEPMGASWQTLATVLEAMGQVRRAELYREWRARGNSDKKPKRRLREVPKHSVQMTFDTSQDLGISFRDYDEDEDRDDEDVFEYREIEGDDEVLDDEVVEAAEEEDEALEDEGSAEKGLPYRNRRRPGRSRGPASNIRLLDPRIYYDPSLYVLIGTIPFKRGKEAVLPQGKWRPKPIDPNLFDPNEDYRRPIRVIWADQPKSEPEPRQGAARDELRKELKRPARIIEIPENWSETRRSVTGDNDVDLAIMKPPTSDWAGSTTWSVFSPWKEYRYAKSLNIGRSAA